MSDAPTPTGYYCLLEPIKFIPPSIEPGYWLCRLLSHGEQAFKGPFYPKNKLMKLIYNIFKKHLGPYKEILKIGDMVCTHCGNVHAIKFKEKTYFLSTDYWIYKYKGDVNE